MGRGAEATGGQAVLIDVALLEPAEEAPTELEGAAALGLLVPERKHAACDEQWAYATCFESCAVCCSRRAGKTNGAVLKAGVLLAKANKWGHYISLLRRNALTQFFLPLLDFLERPASRGGLGWRRDIDFTANLNNLMITTAWGSNLKAASCPTLGDVSNAKGDRTDWFAIDECQEPADDVITALVTVAAEPMTTDTGGAIDMLGTPPEAEPCLFSESLDNPGWRVFVWTQFDHDLPRSREQKWKTAKATFARRGLKFSVSETVNDNGQLQLKLDQDPEATHPIVSREYFGRRVRDPGKLAYEYLPGRNDYDPDLVTLDLAGGHYRIGGGIDIGWSDHDAIAVPVTRYDDPERKIYVPWIWQRRHLDVFDLADLLMCVNEVFPFHYESVVGDHGGHGATKTMKSLETILRLPIHAKPGNVEDSVGLMNDDFRSARLLIATKDVWTPLIAAAAVRVFPGDIERRILVWAMLGWKPRQTEAEIRERFADRPERLAALLECLHESQEFTLGQELGKVSKTINPRTKKLEFNKKGFHSDKSEALRYGHAALTRSAADPRKAPPETDPDKRRHNEITAYLNRREENKRLPPWRRR